MHDDILHVEVGLHEEFTDTHRSRFLLIRRFSEVREYDDRELLEIRILTDLAEYLEPAARFEDLDVKDTIVFFGSARFLPREDAEKALETARSAGAEGEELKRAEMVVHMSRYYEATRELAEAIRIPVTASGGMSTLDDIDAVKKMVEAGLGVAVVAAWTVRDEIAGGTLIARPLGNSGVYRAWGLIQRAGETLTASQRGFTSICKSRFPALIE